MGEWKRPWDRRTHRSCRPPPHPPHGPVDNSVPLWEKKFCSYVGGIPWQSFCDTKKFISVPKIVDEWDDSAAFENFQNAKARFWAEYHGVPSDIPLPDPDMYIDKVDYYVIIDPELVADLEREQSGHELNNSVPNSGISFDAVNELMPDVGLGKEGKQNENQSVNWDVFIEKPAEANKANKWEINSNSHSSWGIKDEPRNEWYNNRPCWGEAVARQEWHRSSNGYYLSTNRTSSYGVSNSRYGEQSNRNGRKRNFGGYLEARSTRHKYQAEGCQTTNSSRDCSGRNSSRQPFYKTAY